METLLTDYLIDDELLGRDNPINSVAINNIDTSELDFESIINRWYNSISDLSKDLYPQLLTNPDGEYIPPSLIEDEFDDLVRNAVKDKYNFLGILPRGLGKSTKINVFTLTYILLFTNKKYIIMCGASISDIKKHFQTFKSNFLDNPIVKALGVEVCGSNNDSEVEIKVPLFNLNDKNSKNGYKVCKIQCISMSSGSRGYNYRGSRPDCFILDDLEIQGRGNKMGVENPKYREQVQLFFRTIVLGSAFSLDYCTIFMIGTVLHEEQLLLQIERDYTSSESSPYFKVLRSPMVVNFGKHDAYSIWDAKFSVSEFNKMYDTAKRSGRLKNFYSEYQQELVVSEDAKFNPRDYKYFISKGRNIHRLNNSNDMKSIDMNNPISIDNCTIIVSLDPAYTTNINSDESVISICAIDYEGDIYVLDQIHGKFESNELLGKLVEICRVYKPYRLFIEKNNGHEYFEMSINTAFKANNINLSIDFISHGGIKKHIRIINLLGKYIREHRVYFRIGKPYVQLLESQLEGITESGITVAHDDMADSLNIALLGIERSNVFTLAKNTVSSEEAEYYYKLQSQTTCNYIC